MNPSLDTQRRHPPEPFAGLPEDEIDLRDLLRKLNRRKAVIFGVFILVFVLTMLYISRQTLLYTATAQLMFNTRTNQVVDVGDVLSNLPISAWENETVVASEIDIIRSGPFLERVVDRLNLIRDPLFNPELRPPAEKSLLTDVRGWIKSLLPWKSGPEPAPAPAEPVDPKIRADQLRKMIAGMLAGGLKPEHVRDSFTLRLSFTFTEPERSAKVVNAIADAYLMDQLEAKFEATRRANEWLAERLNSLRAEVHAKELAVQKVREKGNLVQTRGSTLLEQQIAEINAQLVIARVNRSQAETRLQWVRENLGAANALESMMDSLSSPEIQRMRTEETQMRRKQVELSGRYGPRHPEMLKITAELNDLQKKIREEAQRMLESLANEVEIGKAKERGLVQSLEEMRSQTSTSLQMEVELAELERQAQVARTLYENFLSRFQETSEQEKLHRPDARIISYADPPGGPSHPNKRRILGIGGIVGLMLGFMLAFLLEALDRGFRHSEQVEQITGLSALGMVPLLRKYRGTPADYVVEKPLSQLAEAIRGIRAAIQLSNVDHPPKTILVTSSLPGEGKTMFCACLGRMAAMSGAKILLIEGDLRRPKLAGVLDLTPEAWLEEVLAGEKELPSAITTDPKTGLHVICGKGSAPNAADLLGSKRMERLVQDMAGAYDLVIVDSSPLMGVADTWALARSVDEVVFVVQWAETPREIVREAMRQMEVLNLPARGIVLSQVDIRKQAFYGYGNYGSYYGKYQTYYTE